MARFEYHEPTSIAEAVQLAGHFGAESRFLAGGTDLILQLRRGHLSPRHLIALRRTPGLADLQQNGHVVLGPCVTHRSLAGAAGLRGELGALAEAASAIGGPQVRNVGTVGGNIVSASPAADLLPPLLALDASLSLISTAGERELPVERFLAGRGRTARRAEELLLRVTLPPLPPRSASAFLKAGWRKAMEVSVVCVAVRLTLDETLDRCREARIALGAVADQTVRAPAAERWLEDHPIESGSFGRAAQLALEAVDPISDPSASARFRRHLVVALVSRALGRCLDRVRGGTR
jgi:carbon-monoxide dehydrogenase medium subunit